MLGADPTASDPPARPALQRPAELLAGGRPADAAAALQAVVAGAPTYAAAFVLLGVALDAAGRPGEALAAWHRAAFLVPNSPLVLRERRRLLEATAAPEPLEEPAAEPAEAPADEAQIEEALVAETSTDAFLAGETPDDESLADPFPAVEAEPVEAADDADWMPAHDDEPLEGADAPDAAAPDALETAPLDDFIFADTPTEAADDAFDPDSFDFSAFDIGDDDDAAWLTEPASGPPTSGPTTIDLAEFGLADDDEMTASFDPPADLADWAETTDASVRLMPPEAAEPAPETPEPDGEAPDEAVFQDVPEPPAGPLDAPVSNDLAPEAPPAEAAWTPDPPASPASVADELDSLIASLETAPRIRPDPAFSGPAVRATEADVDAMASETLARIYAAQNQYVRAALVYETLAAREPDRAGEMLAQAAEMRRRG